MATTVGNAFAEFLRDKINLEKDIVAEARKSRDNLLDNISEFDSQDNFFDLCQEYNVHFGSFARKTKCRDLDDIDLMIGISADGAKYYSDDPWNSVRITASPSDAAQIACTDDDGFLNSTKVLNMFKKKLEHVKEYSHSDLKKDHEAVVLNLISKDWSFDIVPCFHTVTESDGRSYYLISNGNGNWKKTNPKIDRDHVSSVNQICKGNVLELIRLVKYWNKRPTMATIPSYTLEAMVLNYCEKNGCSEYIDLAFRDVLNYISQNIYYSVQDPKGIQGNINSLTPGEMQSVNQRAVADYKNACQARQYEQNGDMRNALMFWRKVLGYDFPTYG